MAVMADSVPVDDRVAPLMRVFMRAPRAAASVTLQWLWLSYGPGLTGAGQGGTL